MDKSKIKTAARKALIAADHNYYSWPEQQQEQFRATMDNAAQSRVEAVLLKNLQGIQCTAENASEIWSDLPISKLDNLNWAKLLTSGMGDDYIFLNESMAENKSLLDFNSLYDFDYDDYLFQEQANKKEFIQDSPTVFTEDVNQDGELHRNFIFNNENALKQTRWKHFLADCELLTADFTNAIEMAEQEVARAEAYLQEAYEDIMKNFDPNVVKLKKKMQVVVAPGAFDGLIEDDTGDE